MVLCLLAAAGICVGGRSASFQAPNSSDWTHVAASPLAVAQSVDEHLHGMHNVILHYVFGFKLPQGRFTYSGYGAVKDSHTFRVQAPLVGHTEMDTDTVAYICSGGKLTTVKMFRGKPVSTVRGPWPGKRTLEPDLMDEWFRNCAGAMLTGVGSNVNPLEAFVK